MAEVLVVDDDLSTCNMLLQMLHRLGHDGAYALDLEESWKAVETGRFDLILLDVKLPDGSGLDLLPRIQNLPDAPEVIIVTGLDDPDSAGLAIRSGAWAYIQKPVSMKDLALHLSRTLEFREMKKARRPLLALNREGIVGNSPKLLACLNGMAEAAASEGSVLISGETGTGKELFALGIHNNSRRADKSFVVVDCSTIPETLVESTLFGHEKGAFSGADRARDGLIKQADGGTLFLDEIGDLPFSAQKSLLRVLENQSFRPLGAAQMIYSDFRLISATNRDLEQMVREGQFRQDLLFRIRSLTVELPPLRERKEDIKELITYQLNRLARKYNTEVKGFSNDFVETLAAYQWPGNVRELFQTLEHAFASAYLDPILLPFHIPARIRAEIARHAVDQSKTGCGWEMEITEQPGASEMGFPTLKQVRSSAERRYLRDLMRYTQWNIAEACSLSGLSRSRLYDLLKIHRISRNCSQ